MRSGYSTYGDASSPASALSAADRALTATVAVPQVLYPQRIEHLLKLEKSPDFAISPQCWIKTVSKLSSMGAAQLSPAEHAGLRK